MSLSNMPTGESPSATTRWISRSDRSRTWVILDRRVDGERGGALVSPAKHQRISKQHLGDHIQLVLTDRSHLAEG
jgi:hypothetical protein